VSNGTLFFARTPGANAPPSVNAGPDEVRVGGGREVALQASASDPDGDWLTYVWTLDNGQNIRTRASRCCPTAPTPSR